jgi:uncharacterized membrane protein YfcA
MIAVFAGTGAIGVSIGLVGIGGVFLIPLLVWSGLPLEKAIGTSLVTFTVTGVVATLIYAQGRTIDWHATLLTSAGSLLSGTLGAKLSTVLPARVVTACFAFFLLVSAFSALFGSRRLPGAERRRRLGPAALFGCGIVAGIGSGLTGVGGPAVLVPLMLLLRASPATAVAISQPNSIVAAGSGALGHIVFGHVDFRLAALLAVFCGTGVVVGAIVHRHTSSERLRRVIGLAALVLALYLIGKLVGTGEGL